MVPDLGSGALLLSLPAVTVTAEVVCAALRSLFREHGAPLVLKNDNGSGFIAEATRTLLDAHGVLPLLSPPSTPRFNEASRHGRPGEWTCDDVEAARGIANATSRPLGAARPRPDELVPPHGAAAGRAEGLDRNAREAHNGGA